MIVYRRRNAGRYGLQWALFLNAQVWLSATRPRVCTLWARLPLGLATQTLAASTRPSIKSIEVYLQHPVL